jgi:hypothetical protein
VPGRKPVFVFKKFGGCAKLPAGINPKRANEKRCWILDAGFWMLFYFFA